jgi:hypothetical protein
VLNTLTKKTHVYLNVWKFTLREKVLMGSDNFLGGVQIFLGAEGEVGDGRVGGEFAQGAMLPNGTGTHHWGGLGA